jgi:hypothetical protein
MNAAALTAVAERIEALPLATAIAESRYAFPAIEGLHLIGLSIAVGLLFITDLRLANVVLKRIAWQRVLHELRPWVLGGFAAIFITGGLLFIAEASSLVGNRAFLLKLVFIALAALNAAYFELVIAKRVALDGAAMRPPATVRAAAITSLTLWTLVIVCGRLIPYLPSGGA